MEALRLTLSQSLAGFDCLLLPSVPDHSCVSQGCPPTHAYACGRPGEGWGRDAGCHKGLWPWRRLSAGCSCKHHRQHWTVNHERETHLLAKMVQLTCKQWNMGDHYTHQAAKFTEGKSNSHVWDAEGSRGVTSSLGEREMPSQSSVSAGDKDIHQNEHTFEHTFMGTFLYPWKHRERKGRGGGRGWIGEEEGRKECGGGRGGDLTLCLLSSWDASLHMGCQISEPAHRHTHGHIVNIHRSIINLMIHVWNKKCCVCDLFHSQFI